MFKSLAYKWKLVVKIKLITMKLNALTETIKFLNPQSSNMDHGTSVFIIPAGDTDCSHRTQGQGQDYGSRLAVMMKAFSSSQCCSVK